MAQCDTRYHNAVLSELAVDGMWPCQVAEAPYLLLLAHCILATLADPDEKYSFAADKNVWPLPSKFSKIAVTNNSYFL
jgi:hypothetical protein